MSQLTVGSADLICLSHLRWNFVFQRPQHLMTRCSRERRVFFVEEPVISAGADARLEVDRASGVTVVVPHLPEGLSAEEMRSLQRHLLDDFRLKENIRDFVLWFYTPMALPIVDHWRPRAIVYDCMDELSAFHGAPPDLLMFESRLLKRASLVLTGGHALYHAKRKRHHNIHPFPSSVDVAHFRQARRLSADPPDQAGVPRPRLGFFGVIDERMDLALVDGLAAARPNWQIVFIGPVVKIDPATLPRRANIHYLGSKSYDELPAYIAGWSVALMPFALNAATAFISPTKTPEYLAAGKPVVSTPLRDVVQPYGIRDLVRIAAGTEAFVQACEDAMTDGVSARVARAARADIFLSQTSWDDTWRRISSLIDEVLHEQPARGQAVPSLVTEPSIA
jgi:glycosyltransferase involved in cell wall biosynthesis